MIGGEHFFAIPGNVEQSIGNLLSTKLGDISFFSTGRDALKSLLHTLPDKLIYLPDLTCSSITNACRASSLEIHNYEISDNYCAPNQEFTFEKAGSVFVIHYFGKYNSHLVNRAKTNGHIVISDVTHLLFDRIALCRAAEESDYLIASLRKSGPFPDGGFISSTKCTVVKPKKSIREDFFTYRTAGLLSRGFSAANNFASDENFVLLKKAEELLDNSDPSDYSCSDLSISLLNTISIPVSAEKIHKNVSVLLKALSIVSTISVVMNDEEISPYFPILLPSSEQRDSVRSHLAAHQYYFPVHWLESGLPKASNLSQISLSIPCDARYNEEDMQDIIDVIMTSCSL